MKSARIFDIITIITNTYTYAHTPATCRFCGFSFPEINFKVSAVAKSPGGSFSISLQNHLPQLPHRDRDLDLGLFHLVP